MASSTLSLDSLSSPSPSPSPPPTTSGTKSKQSNTGSTATVPKAATAALDSDSELSELTDDDQEGIVSGDKRDRGASSAAASSSKATAGPPAHSAQTATRVAPPTAESSVDDEDDENDNNTGTSSTNHISRGAAGKRGSHQRTHSTTSRRGAGRKKRSSIVPAPMWGWAETKTTASSSANVEEEEEEIPGPPRAMEEEEEEPPEEEEEVVGDGDYDTSYNNGRDDSAGIEEYEEEEGGFVNQRRLGPYVTQRLPGIRSFYRRGRGGGKGGRRQAAVVSSRKPVNDEEEDEPIPNGDDVDDASASGSEYNNSSSTRKKAHRATTRARGGSVAASRKRKEGGGHESSASEAPVNATGKRKMKKASRAQQRITTLHEGENLLEDDAASEPPNVAVDAGTGDENTEDEEDITPRKTVPAAIPSASSQSPTRSTLPALKPLSAIGHVSTANPGAANLTALAVIADLDQPTMLESAGDAGKIISPSSSSGAAAVEMEDIVSKLATQDPSVPTSVDPTPAVSTVNSDTEAESKGWTTKTRKATRTLSTSKKALKVSTSSLGDEDQTENGDEQADVMDVDPEAKDDDKDVDMEGDEREEIDEEDVEDEAEDDEQVPADEDAAEVEVEAEIEGEDEAGDGDEEPGEPGADNDEEQEKDNEEVENEEEPSPDVELEDQEIELQPAHRAEALDVLASIELKFALLRERVYVEKMENLAWEETMIQSSVHPEMLHLQKEMTNRRDKRLQLASRKRSFEVANASKRRKADEDGVWSWWKLSVEDLQTDMIAETNRKRRKLERDRRATERPQPIRRIPLPPPIETVPPHQPPSIRKIIKSYPFDSARKHSSKTHSRRHAPPAHFTNGQLPSRNLIYPEISTLSAGDISSDLEYLFQNRRIPSTSFDGIQYGNAQPPPPLWGQSLGSQRNGSGLGRTMSMGLGMGVNNGSFPPSNSQTSIMGPPPPPSTHGMGYDIYQADSSFTNSGPSGPPSRIDQASGSYGAGSGRSRPPYSMEHEMSTMGPAPGAGHQLLPNHPYFGNAGPGPSVMKNGRRSLSPPPSQMPSNGAGPPGMRMNGGWMGMPVKNSDRDMRMAIEEDERMRERERDKDRRRGTGGDRDKELERREQWEDAERERLRDRDRDSHRAGPGLEPHHHPNRPHHHHIVHRHGPPHASSSLPSPGPSGPGNALPIVHSPRSGREYDGPRPTQNHATTEIIMLSSNKPSQRPRDRDTPVGPPHAPADYRERDRERDMHKLYAQRPTSRPPLDGNDDRHERPLATPFAMAPTHMQQSSAGPLQINGGGSSSSSPKHQPVWNTPAGAEDPSYRTAAAYPVHGEPHRSPNQSHRYPPGGIPPPPLGRGIPSSTSSSSSLRMGSPPPPNRSRPPLSPPYLGPSNTHRSPITSPKMRPPSPILGKLLGPGRIATPTGHQPTSISHTPPGPLSSSVLDPMLKNGTNTPNYPLSSRTASPLMSSLHPPPPNMNGSRTTVNGNGIAGLGSVGSALDRERERERQMLSSVGPPRMSTSLMSTPLPVPPPKLTTASMADGR
ncbi:Sds3-like-domain-containing protein [Crepidotus variabilis]|uniref:Sds3-like-domain-containing protein n=1 Tax=Crepidotus variabilis TaxID=179855 RepID=A0A9P6EKL6_9AGAR|nr:Sds3-like-domain-containing protein [Crepidotus variabilis]